MFDIYGIRWFIFCFLEDALYYLYQKDLYRPLMGKEKGKTKDESDVDWDVLDRKTIEQIQLSLTKIVVHNILKERTQ